MLQDGVSRLQHRIDDAIDQLKNLPSSDLDYFVSRQRNMLALWYEEESKILDELGSVQSQQQTQVARVRRYIVFRVTVKDKRCIFMFDVIGDLQVEAGPGRVHNNGTEESETCVPVAVAGGHAILSGSSSFVPRDEDQRSVQCTSEMVSMSKIVAMGGVPALGRMILPLQLDQPKEANDNENNI